MNRPRLHRRARKFTVVIVVFLFLPAVELRGADVGKVAAEPPPLPVGLDAYRQWDKWLASAPSFPPRRS